MAANEAEQAAPENTLVDVTMIGASGRVYVAGRTEGVSVARDRIERLLAGDLRTQAMSTPEASSGVSPRAGGSPEDSPPESGAGESPEQILLGYDPFARAALDPFGFSGQAQLSLLGLSENATYQVDDAEDGRTAVLRVHRTGYHRPGAVASELAWLQALRRDEGADPGRDPRPMAATWWTSRSGR